MVKQDHQLHRTRRCWRDHYGNGILYRYLGTEESVASSATSAVANVNDDPTGSVTIEVLQHKEKHYSIERLADAMD